MTRGWSTLFALSFALLLAVPLSASAVDCSSLPNTHPADAGEVAGVAPGTCVPDNAQQSGLFGGCDFNPYPVLEAFKSGGNVHITPSDASGDLRNGINPGLACRVAQFLKYAQTQGCVFRIASAYRSAQEQYNICGNGGHNCGAPGRSCHQYGLAVDLSGNGRCMAWAKQIMGSKNPNSPAAQQFKLHWPITSDDGHTQCIENLAGACDQSTRPCDGSVRITPDLSVIPGPGTAMPFDQQMRQALGVPPPPPPPQMQQPIQPLQSLTQPAPPLPTASSTPPIGTLNSTPYPPGTCNPQTYCSQSDGNIYYRATTCVDQVYQKCTSGCTGLICNATSTANSQLGGLTSPDTTNGNLNDNSNTNATSTFNLIDFFANPPVATNIGTATPIDITNAIQDTGNASTLQPPPGQGGQTPPQGTASGYGPLPQQTFTSGDLANSPGAYGPQPSTFQAALANMKAALIDVLNHLQPFGGRIAPLQPAFLE